MDRWLLAGKDKLQRSLYVDSETVNKQLVPASNDSFQLVYSFWLKTLAFNGASTPPAKVTVNCSTRLVDTGGEDGPEEIVPESKEEALYKFFCQSADARNTQFPKSQKEIAEEQSKKMQEQQAREAQQRREVLEQQQSAARRAQMTGLMGTGLWQGAYLIRSLAY